MTSNLPPDSARFGPLDDMRALAPIGHGLRERADWGQGAAIRQPSPLPPSCSGHAAQRCFTRDAVLFGERRPKVSLTEETTGGRGATPRGAGRLRERPAIAVPDHADARSSSFEGRARSWLLAAVGVVVTPAKGVSGTVSPK